jgi:hypothetical protein
MFDQETYNRLVDIIAVLVERLGSEASMSEEEIEDSPKIEYRQMFETDQDELRTSRKE